VIRNKLQQLAAPAAGLRPVSLACDEVLHEALGPMEPGGLPDGLPQAEWCRIYALNCLVWSGDVADQTDGATACHRHDRNPPWARSRIPTALLGSYIFFR
jgi:hypothetical protein